MRFVIDQAESRSALLPRRRHACMSRPVLAGSHRIAVRWRGPVGQPVEIKARPLYPCRTLAELERDAPDVAAVMKKNNRGDFVTCNVLIMSQPPGQPCQVYSIFTVDKRASVKKCGNDQAAFLPIACVIGLPSSNLLPS